MKRSRKLVLLALGLVVMLHGNNTQGYEQDIERDRNRGKIMLRLVAEEIEKRFYDEGLRGLDWKDLTSRTLQRIEEADSLGKILTSIHALVNELRDSHTNFISPQRAVRIRFGFAAMPIGDEVRVHSIDEEGPAASAGLEIGGQLIGINGFKVERESFDPMMLFLRILMPIVEMDIALMRDCQRQDIRIKANVVQRLVVEDLTNINNIYRLIRELELEEEEDFAFEDYGDGIGYVRVSFFASKRSLSSVARDSSDSSARIVDLRRNSGGAVDVLEHFSGLFETDESHIADVVGREKRNEEVKAEPRNPHLSGPLFILVDSQSASASEVFARHFQRTGRAVVIGDQTAGRVSASRVFPKKLGVDRIVPFAVQVAIGRVILPDGEELEGSGVTPDVFCVPSVEDQRNDNDVCAEIARGLAREAMGLDPGHGP